MKFMHEGKEYEAKMLGNIIKNGRGQARHFELVTLMVDEESLVSPCIKHIEASLDSVGIDHVSEKREKGMILFTATGKCVYVTTYLHTQL